VFICVHLWFITTEAHAQEWTRFRGPNGSGISEAKSVPVTFTEKEFNWKVALPGVGHSSPVVWKDKIFITSADENTGKRFLFCISAADGKVLWNHAFDFTAYQHHSLNTAASSTPAVDADHVYVVWPAPEQMTLHALTHQGKEVWKRELGAYQSMHGGGMSPIVVGETVIVTKEPEAGLGALLGLDRKTGQVRWKHDRPCTNAAYATPLVYQPPGGPPQVVFTGSAGITSLDPATGALNWELPNVFRARCVGSPVLVGPAAAPLVFATAGTGGGDRQAVALRPGGKGTAPQVAYQPTKGICYVPTPITVGDRLYLWGDGGIVTCLKAGTGEEVWMERAGGNFFGSPVCVDGRLYCVSTTGEVVVIATGDAFKVLARNPLGEASHSTPAISGGVMYLRTLTHLISVGGKKEQAR
jgi:outer membrane protein assembly factor BamB